MKITVHEVILKTGGKTTEELKKDFVGEITDKEISEWKIVLDKIDGTKVYATDSFYDDRFVIIGWPKESEENVKEFVYQAEQDELFGTYENLREEFEKDWNSGNYEPAGSLGFDKEDVEVIKTF